MRFNILSLGLIASTLFFASDVVAAPIDDIPLQSSNINHAAFAEDAVSTIGDGHVGNVLDRVQGGGISDTVGNIGDSINSDTVLDDTLLVGGQNIASGIIDKSPLTRRRLSELLQRRAKPVSAEDIATPAAGAVEATEKAVGATDKAAIKTTGGPSNPEDEEEPDEEEPDEVELERRSEKDEEEEDEDEKDEDEGGNSTKPSKRGLSNNIRAAAMRRRSFGEPVKSISGAISNVMNPTKRAAASDDVSGPADEEDEEEKDEEEADEEEADEEEPDELGDASPTNRR
ncbi:MAG: hypothetical protein EXX96DRAFT_577130 [Benjaminiella poitrasii]|nr:MAG: hypothetical protein EXX96DRAFT_577130 [Benjaminiella poitrasii]